MGELDALPFNTTYCWFAVQALMACSCCGVGMKGTHSCLVVLQTVCGLEAQNLGPFGFARAGEAAEICEQQVVVD